MKVLFDHQIFSLQKVGGISRYFYELHKNLGKHHVESGFSARYGENQFLNLKDFPGTGHLPFRIRSRMNEVFNRAHSLKEIRSKNYQVLHPTYYSTYHLKPKKLPFVITIYDLIPVQFSGFPRKQVFTRNMTKLSLAADKIIAISEHTKNDILKYLNTPPEKVAVIPLASSIEEITPSNPNLPFDRYILFVGERGGYKNFNALKKAFADLAIPGLKLLCVGGGAFSQEEEADFQSLGILQNVFQKRLSDPELAWAYKHCVAFVFPSLYEGFGIPILESMQMGAITLLSDASCFPEIGQNGASYFRGHDELVDLLRISATRPSELQSIRTQAAQVTRQYHWDLTAKKTAELYQSLV